MSIFPFGKRKPVTPPSLHPIDWDAFYNEPRFSAMVAAIRDLDQRMLALEGKDSEAAHRLAIHEARAALYEKVSA